ncbi:hypothetical protein [Nocardioides sp. cx-169]|nr:hypothetical protein [Nocardioides sp. cx-169]
MADSPLTRLKVWDGSAGNIAGDDKPTVTRLTMFVDGRLAD